MRRNASRDSIKKPMLRFLVIGPVGGLLAVVIPVITMDMACGLFDRTVASYRFLLSLLLWNLTLYALLCLEMSRLDNKSFTSISKYVTFRNSPSAPGYHIESVTEQLL